MAAPRRPDFSTASPPPPPPPAAPSDPNAPQFQFQDNQLPLPMNAPISLNAANSSEYTKAQLRKLGWKDGEGVPPTLAPKLKEIQTRMAREKAAASANIPTKPGRRAEPSKIVDIDDLSPEDRAECEAVLRNWQAQQAGAKTTATAPAKPSFQLPEVAIQHAPPVIQGMERVPTPTEPIPTELEDEPAPPQADEHARDHVGGGLKLLNCPRCLFDLQARFDLHPTSDDKYRFAAALLGNTRFTKTYDLIGGNIQVTFRTLLSREADAIYTQIRKESQQQKFMGESDFMMRFHDLRMALSIDRIVTAGIDMAEVPGLFEVAYTPTLDEPTPILPLYKWINEDALPQHSLRTAVFNHFRIFGRLVEALEAMTGEPDFWKGIGLQD